MAEFFIKRPIFAWVIAILTMMAGVFAIMALPIAQYPAIALPQISITATYPGASAETLSNTVTQVIEQNMTGIDNLTYIASTSESTGSAVVTLTFKAGTDSDTAQVQVQNKLQLALPLLPDIVQRLGLTVKKANSNYLLVAAFVSTDRSQTNSQIADYVASNLKDPISRLEGVGDITIFGSQHAMRIWVDPDKLSNYNLTLADIGAVLRNQNLQVSAGQFGDMPQTPGQRLNATITAQSQLETREQFEAIIIRVNGDGSSLRLADVARVELGEERYSIVSFYNGQPAAGIGIYLAPGANALATADRIKRYLSEASGRFPNGLAVAYPYDTTPFVRLSVCPFVRLSIREVFKTLIEAFILVFLVMYLFLQNLRATLIPAIAVPVVLLGVFAILAAANSSINTLTMFGMVLAIGLLVDDAIVVVENVERLMEEEELLPPEATRRSMKQISGALIGVALVLSAVFLPMAFLGGSVGIILRQFAITIVSAMILSVLVALSITPALCATLLKPHRTAAMPQRGLFGLFNRVFSRLAAFFGAGVAATVARSVRSLLVYACIAALVVFLFWRIPTAFLPDEDQGILFVEIQLPPGATMERTLAVVEHVERHFMEAEQSTVASIFVVAGYSYAGSGQNSALAFVSLKDWETRTQPEHQVKAVVARAAAAFAAIHDAAIFPFIPPPVVELGNATGFEMQLLDYEGLGHDQLMASRNRLLFASLNEKYAGRVRNVRPNGKAVVPQLRLEVDPVRAMAYGVALADIHDLLQTGWGGGYINDFLDRGRLKKVYLQATPDARMLPEDFDRWYVRNRSNEMVPFGALVEKRWEMGSPRLERFNGIPSMQIMGEAAPGMGTGLALSAMEEIAATLPDGFGVAWSGLSLQEKQAGGQSTILYAVSILVVFLCLAALYESWIIPFAVLLTVPPGVLGVQAAALVFNQANDVYFQVAVLTIIGLSAKNAILIVDFAKVLVETGSNPGDAAVRAAV